MGRIGQQRGLLVELIAFLQHRQGATGALVTEHVREAEARANLHEWRHSSVAERLEGIERRLARLDAQMGDLRAATATLRPPAVAASHNGVVPNGKVNGAVDRPRAGTRATEAEAPARTASRCCASKAWPKRSAARTSCATSPSTIYEDEILGLIGPNGAGKTTLMECLAGMRPRTRRHVLHRRRGAADWDPKDLLFYLPNNVLPYGELYTIEVLKFFGRAVRGRAAALGADRRCATCRWDRCWQTGERAVEGQHAAAADRPGADVAAAAAGARRAVRRARPASDLRP